MNPNKGGLEFSQNIIEEKKEYNLADIINAEGLGVGLSNKSEKEMIENGWEEFFSFHGHDQENIKITYEKIKKAQSDIREFKLTKVDNPDQRKENILLVWRRFTKDYLNKQKKYHKEKSDK